MRQGPIVHFTHSGCRPDAFVAPDSRALQANVLCLFSISTVMRCQPFGSPRATAVPDRTPKKSLLSKRMAPNPITYPCFTCGGEFRFGPHVYDGHHIGAYQINVCRPCWGGNWDGWTPRHESKLLARLRELSLPIPTRNAAGYLPRDP